MGSLPRGDTGKSVKSWKAMMDSGQDPREGFFSIFRLIVSWLLAVPKKHNISCICIHSQHWEFVVVRGCTIMHMENFNIHKTIVKFFPLVKLAIWGLLANTAKISSH